MSIRKEDVHELVDKMDQTETTIAYKLLKKILMKQFEDETVLSIEADNEPLNEGEQKELAEVIKEDTIDWEVLKRELDL